MPEPLFRSRVFDDIPSPDYADMAIAPIPAGATLDPEQWALAVFDVRSMPLWLRGAMGARQALAPLIGVRRAGRDIFDVHSVRGEEALLKADEPHLDFRVGVGVDAERRLVRVVTAVRLKGWRGRVYFAPVRLAHPLVVESMLRRASRRLAAA